MNKCVTIILLVLMCGCASPKLVELKTNNDGEDYWIETEAWKKNKERGKIISFGMGLVLGGLSVYAMIEAQDD